VDLCVAEVVVGEKRGGWWRFHSDAHINDVAVVLSAIRKQSGLRPFIPNYGSAGKSFIQTAPVSPYPVKDLLNHPSLIIS
jgi:hypothetical protein